MVDSNNEEVGKNRTRRINTKISPCEVWVFTGVKIYPGDGRVWEGGSVWAKNLNETECLGRTRCNWEDKTEADRKETGWKCLDCIRLALVRATGGFV